MQFEEIRKKREAAQILLTFFRCVSMKRALNCDERDHLNFFCLYDGCLMDVAALSWWKIFGNDKEQSHWKKVCGVEISDAIHNACKNDDGFKKLWCDVKIYRHKYIAHHEYDRSRPDNHIDLEPLWAPAFVAYRKIFDDLVDENAADGLPHPQNLTGDHRARQEKHWSAVAAAARNATSHFKDAP